MHQPSHVAPIKLNPAGQGVGVVASLGAKVSVVGAAVLATLALEGIFKQLIETKFSTWKREY